MNLHSVVRGVISSVNADEPIKFFTNVGQENIKGKVTQVYEVSDRMAQIQAPSASDMRLFERVVDAKHRIKAYVYAPASTINRVTATAGDMIQRADGTYWLVVGTIDDFSKEGWLCCMCTLQTKAPEKIKIVEDTGEVTDNANAESDIVGS
jgi:hypothetical protein